MSLTFKEKYLKYKQKYLDLKKALEQSGGFDHNSEIEDFDFKKVDNSEIDSESIEELKKRLDEIDDLEETELLGGADKKKDSDEDFEFELKEDFEGDFEISDSFSDLDELFGEIDDDDLDEFE